MLSGFNTNDQRKECRKYINCWKKVVEVPSGHPTDDDVAIDLVISEIRGPFTSSLESISDEIWRYWNKLSECRSVTLRLDIRLDEKNKFKTLNSTLERVDYLQNDLVLFVARASRKNAPINFATLESILTQMVFGTKGSKRNAYRYMKLLFDKLTADRINFAEKAPTSEIVRLYDASESAYKLIKAQHHHD